MSVYEQIASSTPYFNDMKKCVVSLSGGLDSTTLLYLMVKKLGPENVAAISFNYNQRHDIELTCASRTCEKLKVFHKIIDIGFLGEIVSGVSAMVKGDVATPTMGDLAAKKTVPTYVPFRNTILSGITFAFAESVGADAIALGVQYGDYENSEVYHYWDCSKKFTETMQTLADLNDKHSIKYVTPFVKLRKTDELRLGAELGVDYSLTNTCYNPRIEETIVWSSEPMGGKITLTKKKYFPCNVCPSCNGRAEAFKELNLEDPVLKGIEG